MCLEENAVGSCDTCGHVGEACLRIHQKGRSFRTHITNVLKKERQAGDRIEISEERCKQHPSERAFFLCNIHDSMVCGRCLHSEHSPCAKEVVDLEQEGAKIDCEKVNTIKSLFNELKDEISIMKDEADHSMESCKNNSDTCVQECMELEKKIKQRVDQVTRNIREGIAMKHAKNVSTHSRITKTCEEKAIWCTNEDNKIDDFVDNNMAGYLYLMGRHFEKDISDARSDLKEIKSKQTFKGINFTENKVILKCLFEDLDDVGEQHEEVTGSDDGNSDDVVTPTTEINKTRRELTALLNQAKHNLDTSEKTQKALRDELKRVKQDLCHSKKTEKQFEQELLKSKQDIVKSEKTRRELTALLKRAKHELNESEKTRSSLYDELKGVKQELDKSEKTRESLSGELEQVKQDLDNSEKEKIA